MVDRDPLSCTAPLFVPADRPERFAKAASSGADAVIIDLEDAVAPARKAQARNAVRALQPLQVATFLRINAARTEWHDDDLVAARGAALAGLVLPKAELDDEIRRLRQTMGPDLAIIALIETAQGLAHVRDIAAANSRIRLAFGSIDFCADVGCAHTRDALLFARSQIVLASRLAEIRAPLDGVATETGEAEVIDDQARYARELGFAGKLCIHPRQVAPTFRGFAPSQGELDWARSVLSVEHDGAVAINGQMIDAPVRRRARQLLARAGISG